VSSQEDKPGETVFEKFLLKEYDNIAQAHFNTTATISTFFRYYLLIISFPLTALTILTKTVESASSYIPSASMLVWLSIFLCAVGLSIMGYILNLRFDAILYARQVNGIRDIFWKKSDLPPDLEAKTRVLPRSTDLPKYYETQYFFCVVIAFFLLDSLYPFIGLRYYMAQTGDSCSCNWLIPSIASGISIAIHWACYYYLAWHRENNYLKDRPA
jgi:hypothetical protein